jgi:hypothetical protein
LIFEAQPVDINLQKPVVGEFLAVAHGTVPVWRHGREIRRETM